MLQKSQVFLLPGGVEDKTMKSACIHGTLCDVVSEGFSDGASRHLAFSSALEKKLNRELRDPSVCMQQPCTSVWTTLLTKTRLMDLEEELNR